MNHSSFLGFDSDFLSQRRVAVASLYFKRSCFYRRKGSSNATYVMDSDLHKFKYRGSAFSQSFVNHFFTVLNRYTQTISQGRKDKDASNVLVDGLGWIIGG